MQDLIPSMSSNVSDKGIAFASEVYKNDGRFLEYKAFNKTNIDSDDCWVSDDYNAILGYNFLKKVKVVSYSITARNHNIYINAPKRWFFEGSNDNKNWTTIDEQTITNKWYKNVTKKFDINNSLAYQYYRLRFTETQGGGGNYIAIGELKMFGEVSNNKYLFQDNDSLKTFDLSAKEWITISPSQNNFNNLGVNSLDNLIINTSKQIKHSKVASKTFTEKVNFKSFKTISNIKVV